MCIFDDWEGRFMACTGGWDWAPYSASTTKNSGNATSADAPSFSKGIWKSVYVKQIKSNAVCNTVFDTSRSIYFNDFNDFKN